MITPRLLVVLAVLVIIANVIAAVVNIVNDQWPYTLINAVALVVVVYALHWARVNRQRTP